MISFRLWPPFLTVNEGKGPVNFAIGWPLGRFFWYFYINDRRWHTKGRRSQAGIRNDHG